MSIPFDHGGNVFAVARSLGVSPEDILDFSASINPLGPAPGVKEALLSTFDRVMHYPDNDADDLKLALATFHGVDPAHIAVANGSTELIYLIPRLVAGRRGLIIAPPFSEYAKSLLRAGWEIDYLELRPEEGFSLSLAELERRLGEGYDVLFLCNPGNPTGRLFPQGNVAEIVDLCRSRGPFLVLDEAFMDFCEGESAKRLVVGGGEGVVLRSMTKFFAVPGLRIGYAMAHESVIGRIAALREPWSVNTVAQVAGLASLADRDYMERTIRYVAGERDFLAAGLAAFAGLKPYPSAVNYILVEIRTGLSAAELKRALLKERILIRDCANFHGLSERFFRVAVRTREENERLLAALTGRLI
ncbi:MAG: threonine-phosphate [Geobacteraceae bacterium]|nr:MAG: threonine-phosphate [Geobacteraceae bacterium]